MGNISRTPRGGGAEIPPNITPFTGGYIWGGFNIFLGGFILGRYLLEYDWFEPRPALIGGSGVGGLITFKITTQTI